VHRRRRVGEHRLGGHRFGDVGDVVRGCRRVHCDDTGSGHPGGECRRGKAFVVAHPHDHQVAAAHPGDEQLLVEAHCFAGDRGEAPRAVVFDTDEVGLGRSATRQASSLAMEPSVFQVLTPCLPYPAWYLMVLNWVYSSMPWAPFSRPIPERLYPPNGTSGLV